MRVESPQTALIVVVPQAGPAVGRHRAVLDRAASWGIPAHITVLYPFLPPQRIDDQVLAALRDTIAGVPRFDAVLTHVDWFGDTAAWLAPRPDPPLRALTEAVWRRFPQAPPYEGAHDEIVPHLTIGHDAPRTVLQQAAQAVTAYLPIPFLVDAVRLITGVPERDPWRTVCEFPLGERAR